MQIPLQGKYTKINTNKHISYSPAQLDRSAELPGNS